MYYVQFANYLQMQNPPHASSAFFFTILSRKKCCDVPPDHQAGRPHNFICQMNVRLSLDDLVWVSAKYIILIKMDGRRSIEAGRGSGLFAVLSIPIEFRHVCFAVPRSYSQSVKYLSTDGFDRILVGRRYFDTFF